MRQSQSGARPAPRRNVFPDRFGSDASGSGGAGAPNVAPLSDSTRKDNALGSGSADGRNDGADDGATHSGIGGRILRRRGLHHGGPALAAHPRADRQGDLARRAGRGRPDPARQHRSASGLRGVARAFVVPSGAEGHGRGQAAGTRNAPDRPAGRRGAGARLRLHRAAAGGPAVEGRRGRRRQSEEFDRAARHLHPRHRGLRHRVRPRAQGIQGRALRRGVAAHVQRGWSARDRGCASCVCGGGPRCSARRPSDGFTSGTA